MKLLVNYTPYPIILNLSPSRGSRGQHNPIGNNPNDNHPNITAARAPTWAPPDHSDVNNFKIGPGSIVLQPGDRVEMTDIGPKSDLYICSENCKYIGHFGMAFYNITDNFLMHVGLVINGRIVFTDRDIVPADVNFGISRVIDQTDPRLMLLNPYFYLLVVIILLVLIGVLCKYAYSSWFGVSASKEKI